MQITKGFFLYIVIILSVLGVAIVANQSAIANIAFFLLGIAASIAVGFAVNESHSSAEFERSVASYRLKQVKRATQELLKEGANTGQLRVRYWYSMGVIIDNLRNLDEYLRHGNEWPTLTEKSIADPKDGWALFDRFVRHVVYDISPYVFVVPDLQVLSKFCVALETVVGTLNAALEPPYVIDVKNSRVIVMEGTDMNDARIQDIKNAYNGLGVAWKDWLIVCGISNNVNN